MYCQQRNGEVRKLEAEPGYWLIVGTFKGSGVTAGAVDP
jgi:hypothetical protein